MIHSKEELNFIDFEYAGIDDISKLLADLCLQPNAPLSKEAEENLLHKAQIVFREDETILERYKSIKDIVAIKWITIIIKHAIKRHESREQKIVEAKQFFERFIDGPFDVSDKDFFSSV